MELSNLATETKNYTGAEIEAVIKSASSYSFERCTNLMDFTKDAKLKDNSQVEKSIIYNIIFDIYNIIFNNYNIILNFYKVISIKHSKK